MMLQNKQVEQPEILPIDHELRLRRFNYEYSFALEWYQDEETVQLVDGLDAPVYDYNKLTKMYEYLDKMGELYFIEMLENNIYRPIGDVTFTKEDLPIVIGDKNYRSKGIGKRVLKALIERGKELGYKDIKVREIYTYNTASQKLFESVGFKKAGNTNKGYTYIYNIR